jgi:hypothetical protein
VDVNPHPPCTCGCHRNVLPLEDDDVFRGGSVGRVRLKSGELVGVAAVAAACVGAGAGHPSRTDRSLLDRPPPAALPLGCQPRQTRGDVEYEYKAQGCDDLCSPARIAPRLAPFRVSPPKLGDRHQWLGQWRHRPSAHKGGVSVINRTPPSKSTWPHATIPVSRQPPLDHGEIVETARPANVNPAVCHHTMWRPAANRSCVKLNVNDCHDEPEAPFRRVAATSTEYSGHKPETRTKLFNHEVLQLPLLVPLAWRRRRGSSRLRSVVIVATKSQIRVLI